MPYGRDLLGKVCRNSPGADTEGWPAGRPGHATASVTSTQGAWKTGQVWVESTHRGTASPAHDRFPGG